MSEPTAHQRLTRAGHSAQFADIVLERHAHELAEKIRALDPIEAALAGQHAWDDAADFIDPEAKR